MTRKRLHKTFQNKIIFNQIYRKVDLNNFYFGDIQI